MPDISAQSMSGLAHRFVGDPNSAIGSLIKRGFTGSAVVDAVPNQTTRELDLAEEAIREAEKIPEEKITPESQLAAATAEGVMSQVMPQVMTQTANALDPGLTATSSLRKETTANTTPDQVAVEAARGVQQVEEEPRPEISPEVEGYLKEVEDHKDTAPKEVVIADGSQTMPLDHQYPAQPVVVLPITPEEEKLGAKKSPKFSLRWLIEWSRRLMKIFVGKVIYRPVAESTAHAT